MKRYVITGTPGAGKTTVIEELHARGHAVVGEAATEVIARRQAAGEAEPWIDAGFVDRVLDLQREWESAAPAGPVCFFDRSPICTLALSRYLGRPDSAALKADLERIQRAGTYQRTVFFLANLGSIEPTAARRISFDEALAFEHLHREIYEQQGYQLCEIGAGTPGERAETILAAVAASVC